MLALAGVLHIIEALTICTTSYGETILHFAMLSIYFGLVVTWMASVYTRLLPSRGKTYSLFAGVLMLVILLLRVCKYRLVDQFDYTLLRAIWYSGYIGVLFIPTLFTMACMYVFYADTPAKHWDERWLLIIPALLLGLVCSNDAHHWVFVPLDNGVPFTGHSLGYRYQWGFYLVAVYCVVVAVCGVLLLVRLSRRTHDPRKAFVPIMAIAMVALVLMSQILLANNRLVHPYKWPEIVVFGTMAVYESCIRLRLFAYNENYAGFFAQAQLAAFIADTQGDPVYHTAMPLSVPPDSLQAARYAPLYLDADTRLSCYALLNGNGYVYYAEDESDLHTINRQLQQANETIARENDLIQAESDVRRRQQHLAQRMRIYRDLTAIMHSRQQRVTAMLQNALPHTPAFRTTVARTLAIQAYIKRGTGMLLCDEGFAEEGLQLALAESAKYLAYCGIEVTPGTIEPVEDAATAFAIYTAFEDICEAHFDAPCRLVVNYAAGRLRLVGDGAPVVIPPTALEVTATATPNGCLYMAALPPKGVDE